MLARIARRLRDPLRWADASQLAKTAIAALVAWMIAVDVLHLAQAFMAPWTALLTVQATVFGTVRTGLQQAVASVLGVLIAFGVWHVFGLDAVALGVTVLAGMAAGSVRWVRAPATTAATAVVVLTTGYIDSSAMLLTRLADTGIGIAVGLLVNLMVWAPLRDRKAASQIDVIDDRVGDLLVDMAAQMRAGSGPEEIDSWIARSDELDNEVDQGWAVLQEARESGRLNPRRAAAGRMQAAEGFVPLLTGLAQALAEVRSMARTIRVARTPPGSWDRCFREPWLELLHRAGTAVARADTGQVRATRAELTALANGLAVEQLHPDLWPVYGALLVNLRNVLDELDVVAEAQPVGVPAAHLSGLPSWRPRRL